MLSTEISMNDVFVTDAAFGITGSAMVIARGPMAVQRAADAPLPVHHHTNDKRTVIRPPNAQRIDGPLLHSARHRFVQHGRWQQASGPDDLAVGKDELSCGPANHGWEP